jgi:hypothetical protein
MYLSYLGLLERIVGVRLTMAESTCLSIMSARYLRMQYVFHKFCSHRLLHFVKVHDEGTGMPDEQNFTTHLLSVKDAIEKAGWLEGSVIHKAWKLWQDTVAIQAELRAREGLPTSVLVQEVSQNPSAEPGVVFI